MQLWWLLIPRYTGSFSRFIYNSISKNFTAFVLVKIKFSSIKFIPSLETLKNAGWPFWNLAIIPLQSEHAYLYNQQNDLPRRSENKAKKKKFRLEQELNPWLLWFQCSALPTEQTLTSWLTSQLMFTSFVFTTYMWWLPCSFPFLNRIKLMMAAETSLKSFLINLSFTTYSNIYRRVNSNFAFR